MSTTPTATEQAKVTPTATRELTPNIVDMQELTQNMKQLAIDTFDAISSNWNSWPRRNGVHFNFCECDPFAFSNEITRAIDVALNALQGFVREKKGPFPTHDEATAKLESLKKAKTWKPGSTDFAQQLKIKRACEPVLLKYIEGHPTTDLAKQIARDLADVVNSQEGHNNPYYGKVHQAATSCLDTLIQQVTLKESGKAPTK